MLRETSLKLRPIKLFAHIYTRSGSPHNVLRYTSLCLHASLTMFEFHTEIQLQSNQHPHHRARSTACTTISSEIIPNGACCMMTGVVEELTKVASGVTEFSGAELITCHPSMVQVSIR